MDCYDILYAGYVKSFRQIKYNLQSIGVDLSELSDELNEIEL